MRNEISTITHVDQPCDHCDDKSGRRAEQIGHGGVLCSRCLRELDRMLAEAES